MKAKWEEVYEEDDRHYTIWRQAILGGWLVTQGSKNIAFVPDPKHKWKIGQEETTKERNRGTR